MLHHHRTALIALLIVAASPTAATAKDDGLHASLQARARIETIDGQFRPGIAPDDTALLLQTDLSAEYDKGPFAIGGELIDSRAYFQRRHSSVSTTEVNALEPVQAYVAADLGESSRLTLGRFTLDLGSRRLVSRSHFRNTVNGFTGARLEMGTAKGPHATLFWTMPQQRLPDDTASIRDNGVELDRERLGVQFFGAYGQQPIAADTHVEGYVYRLAEEDAPDILTRDRKLWTIGARYVRSPRVGQFDGDVEGAYQFGHESLSTARTAARADVSAWTAHASIGRTLAAAWTPRLAVEFDAASGDRSGGDYTRFDPLFGARVFEFGPTSLYGPVSRANLVSVGAVVEATPSSRCDGYLSLRQLWAASDTDSFGATSVRSPTGIAGHDAGVQLDMRVRYWAIPKTLRLDAGFATLFKGRLLTDAANAPDTGDTHYGFLEAVFAI